MGKSFSLNEIPLYSFFFRRVRFWDDSWTSSGVDWGPESSLLSLCVIETVNERKITASLVIETMNLRFSECIRIGKAFTENY